jgi:hypothetical protein
MRSLFPIVATIGAHGRVVPIVSDAHLQLLLGHRGVVDLVGFARSATPLERTAQFVRAQLDRARLARTYNGRRAAENKVVDADVRLDVVTDAVSGAAGTTITVPVTVENATRWWLSSAFPYHPVHLSYRWRDAAGALAVPEGHRSRFAAPVPPGGSASLRVAVELPPSPGRYELAITLVQEAFAWFDDLDPACTARLVANVS